MEKNIKVTVERFDQSFEIPAKSILCVTTQNPTVPNDKAIIKVEGIEKRMLLSETYDNIVFQIREKV